MEKRILQALGVILFLVLIQVLWRPLWRYDLNEAVDPNETEKVAFQIKKGSSAKSIAKSLDKADLIVNQKSFLRTVEQEELDQNLRYGEFLLSPSMTLREIITILTTQGKGEQVVTILEGWTIDDIDARLTELDLIQEGDFRLCTFNCTFEYDFLEGTSSLEGFLFPNTYFVESENFSIEGFINTLLMQFDEQFTEEMEAQIEADGRTLYEVVNVASMIEKEVRTDKDIPIVGGIIWKRLDSDWALGIDATLLYVQDDNELTAEDLAADTPYNTRTQTGLPPTPISNPGLKSLLGAVYPEESDYWYYLTTLDTGEVIYSKTNDEHNLNKDRYLR